MGLRGKDSGTLVGTRTVVCVWVSGQGLEAVAEEGSGSRAILVPRPQRLLRTERLSVRSVQLPLTPRASTCTPSGGHGRRGVPPGPCASKHGSSLADRRLERVAAHHPPQPQPTTLVTSLLGTWSTAAPGSSLSTSPDGVAGPPGEREVTGQDRPPEAQP